MRRGVGLGGLHRWERCSRLGSGVGIQSEPRHTGRPRSHMAGASLLEGAFLLWPSAPGLLLLLVSVRPSQKSAANEANACTIARALWGQLGVGGRSLSPSPIAPTTVAKCF